LLSEPPAVAPAQPLPADDWQRNAKSPAEQLDAPVQRLPWSTPTVIEIDPFDIPDFCRRKVH